MLNAGDHSDTASLTSRACARTSYVPATNHAWAIPTVSPDETKSCQPEVSPLPQSNLMATLSPSGSLAHDAKEYRSPVRPSATLVGVAGASGGWFGLWHD